MKNPVAFAAVVTAASIASSATAYAFAITPDARPYTAALAAAMAIVFGLLGYTCVEDAKS